MTMQLLYRRENLAVKRVPLNVRDDTGEMQAKMSAADSCLSLHSPNHADAFQV